MRYVIWKYKLEVADHQTLQLPINAQPLSVGLVKNEPYLWVRVDADSPKESRGVLILATGRTIPEEHLFLDRFIGRLTTDEGFEFHVFY